MATTPAPDLVPVTLPRAPKNSEQFVFVGVNDQTYQIPTGKTSMVKPEVDYVLHLAEAFASVRDKMVDDLDN